MALVERQKTDSAQQVPSQKQALTIADNLKDPQFFIETFFWIIDKNRKKVPFVLNSPQRKYYAERSNHDLILKARKEGFSSLIEALFLFACMTEENVNAVTMAHTWDDTVIHGDRIRFFLENMGTSDFPFKVIVGKENQSEIHFKDTNSRYWIGTAGAKNFGRGRDITHLHLSEVALYEDQSVLSAVMEACVPNAVKVLESTANGIGELFHKMWTEAGDTQKISPWKRHFFAWFEDSSNYIEPPVGINLRLTSQEQRMMGLHPQIKLGNILWYRAKAEEMADRSKLPQEYPTDDQEAFLHSGRPVFNLEKIQEKKTRCLPPMYVGDLRDDGAKIAFKDGQDGILKVWKVPRPESTYLISADVCEGVPDGDWGVAQVLDRWSWEQVAVMRCRMNPGLWGEELVKLAYYYNNAILAPEVNNQGWSTVEAIKRLEYPHLINTKELWKDEQPRYGFPTTAKTKGQIITALRNALDNDTVYFNERETLQEMETYIVTESGSMEAQKNHHDDRVTSMGIGVYCLKFLDLDRSYAQRARNDQSPLVVTSAVGEFGLDRQRLRRSATGYR